MDDTCERNERMVARRCKRGSSSYLWDAPQVLDGGGNRKGHAVGVAGGDAALENPWRRRMSRRRRARISRKRNRWREETLAEGLKYPRRPAGSTAH